MIRPTFPLQSPRLIHALSLMLRGVCLLRTPTMVRWSWRLDTSAQLWFKPWQQWACIFLWLLHSAGVTVYHHFSSTKIYGFCGAFWLSALEVSYFEGFAEGL